MLAILFYLMSFGNSEAIEHDSDPWIVQVFDIIKTSQPSDRRPVRSPTRELLDLLSSTTILKPRSPQAELRHSQAQALEVRRRIMWSENRSLIRLAKQVHTQQSPNLMKPSIIRLGRYFVDSLEWCFHSLGAIGRGFSLLMSWVTNSG